MEKMISFKKMEVTGATKEEALAKAPFNVNLPGADCTSALRNYKKKHNDVAFTEAVMRQFMAEQLEKKTRNTPGNGCYIVVESAVADTRERPYKITPIKNEEGTRKDGKVFQIIEQGTNRILATTKCKMVPQIDQDGNEILDKEGNVRMKVAAETIKDARKLVDDLYVNKGFKGNTRCELIKEIVKGQKVVFTTEYTPSKNSRQGTYIVFGIEAL